MPTACRPALLIGLAALFFVAGCDVYIPIFHEDPTKITEDRSEADKQIDDRIRGDILSGFVEEELGTLKNVTVDVYERRVLLTGTVETEDVKKTAGAVAASADAVKQVINEIQVTKDTSLHDKADDLSIENRLKANLRKSTEVNSFSLRWHSVDNVVYMFGRAKSVGEKKKALEIARSVPGVRSVVDHIAVQPADGGQSWLDNLI
jgi:osmotically-inducible protein OsmY